MPDKGGQGLTGAEIGMWVGVALAIACVLTLVVMLAVLAFTFYQFYVRKRGFYHTHENQENGQLPHVSANQRKVDSETILPESSNYRYARGPGDKEFYL